MNNQKPIYLIAGGRNNRGRSFEAVMKPVLNEIGRRSPTIAYVGAASGDNWGFYLMISRMIKNAGDCKVQRVLIAPKKADIQKAQSILNTADAVFMSGGDVEAGMQALEEKNMTAFFKDLYLQGKVFFGVSAGSIMLAREWVRWRDPDDDSTAELFPCMGIAPVICDTHAEEDGWEELKAALRLEEVDTVGYGISSGSCLKVYPDGRVEAVGGAVARYIKKGDKAAMQSDLSPG